MSWEERVAGRRAEVLAIMQAVGLLDDLDKELNNFAMRFRKWYGWHFPEMGKIVTGNLAYARSWSSWA